MMKKFVLVALLMFLLIDFFTAQEIRYNVIDPPSITVEGKAEVDIIPNEIYVRIVIQERKIGKEKQSVEFQEREILALVDRIGIDLKNVSLVDANRRYISLNWFRKGHVKKKEFEIKLCKANEVGKLYSGLDGLDISEAYIVRVGHSKLDSISQSIQLKSYKNGRSQAIEICKTLNITLGRPLRIIDTNSEINIRGARANLTNFYLDGMRVSGYLPPSTSPISSFFSSLGSSSKMVEKGIEYYRIKVIGSAHLTYLVLP